MNNRNSAVLCFILLVYFVKQDAFADKEDKSDELEDQEFKLQVEGNFSTETSGPPDSHEAMNNREISSKLSKSNREKRSYEFLMGLVNNNSKFEVTNVDLPPPNMRKQKGQIAANEALLELMVKIAADPDQWEKVHKLLQKIDNDLTTSRKIFDRLHNPEEDNTISNDVHTPTSIKQIFFEKKQEVQQQQTPSSLAEQTIYSPVSHDERVKNPSVPTQNSLQEEDDHDMSKINSDQIQKMVVILNGENKQKSKNHTEAALKTNKWPHFEPEGRILYKPELEIERQNIDPKYPWQSDSKTGGKTYPRNFAYHRVTGHPLYHNFDKNPKAYIAVSVIAPKPLHSRPQDEDLILENELRQLKPWTHKQNLKNMAAIRSRWVIQSENNNQGNMAP